MRTAMDWSPTIDVVVVGTDVDLLILLIHLSSSDNHLYLFKPGSGTYSNNVYTISDIKNSMRGYVMTCCGTTSALHRQGKKAFNLVKHNPELQTLEEVLFDSSSTPDAVALAGEEILFALYGATSTTLPLNTH